MNTTLVPYDEQYIEHLHELVEQPYRLAVTIVMEECDIVLITRSQLLLGKVEIPLPGHWDVRVVTGDFAGLVLDRRVDLEEAIVLCDALDLHYTVEY